jgi:hypothetical protein
VIAAICIIVLFGFTALAVDVARMYEERRELQRTADVSALSGAQLLPVSESAAEVEGQFYVGENPTVHHPGGYNPLTGDLVDARYRSSGGCVIEGETYDCVEATVVAPEFEFLFAPVFGINERSVANGDPLNAHATAVLGSGAPGGEKLVPWMLLDCPDGAKWADETAAVVTAAKTVNPSCPYVFSDDFNGPRTSLFLDSGNPQNGGNFQGVDLAREPGCPDKNSYFGHGGGEFEAILAGDPAACNVGVGARVSAQPGVRVGQVNHGLDERGIDSCMNQDAFNDAVDVGVVGDGLVSIKDSSSPCLMALLLVVHTDPDHPDLTAAVRGDVGSMQHPDPLDVEQGRFSRPNNGASTPLIVRRFAFFYITDRGGPQAPYQGIFVKALDSLGSKLDGPADIDSGIFVVKLTD